MGRSVFSYPDSYVALINNLRNDERLPNLQVGISFNFNNSASDQPLVSSQQGQTQKLIEMFDFIGMSNYRWFDLPIDPSDFAGAIQSFLEDMQKNGVTVPH